ncbi:MAG: rhomboid family intramembrane serine protease [Fimbriimonadales bacterium]|nr:rhomboid family intramembrane serine protease [Fimbriimonadales bacterium]MDW8051065.1 rhomboid family intramembrane serine protease [Armatimonadota bacterium]
MRVAFPIATLAMVGVNTAVLLWVSNRAESVESWGFVPAHPSLVSAFTSMGVHMGWLHWLKNALFLVLFGWYVERVLGWYRWLVLYVLSGLGAIGLHWAMSLTIQPALYHEGLVGASGAISGLVGYFALRFYRHRVRLLWASPSRWGVGIPMWVGVVLWVILQGVGAILDAGQPTPSEVGYWAHLGGFATGLTLALMWGAGAAGEREYTLHQAEQALQQGAAGDALRYLEPLSNTPRPDPYWLYLKGVAWTMLGDTDEARTAFLHALQNALHQRTYALAAQAADQLAQLGQLHALPASMLRALFQHAERHHDSKRALRWLETLTRHPELPERPEWLLLHARLLRQHGQPDAACAVFQQILTEYPDSPQAMIAQLHSTRCPKAP